MDIRSASTAADASTSWLPDPKWNGTDYTLMSKKRHWRRRRRCGGGVGVGSGRKGSRLRHNSDGDDDSAYLNFMPLRLIQLSLLLSLALTLALLKDIYY